MFNVINHCRSIKSYWARISYLPDSEMLPHSSKDVECQLFPSNQCCWDWTMRYSLLKLTRSLRTTTHTYRISREPKEALAHVH